VALPSGAPLGSTKHPKSTDALLYFANVGTSFTVALDNAGINGG